MKEEFESNVLNPLPIVLLGTLIEGRPNYCVIGYISPFNFGNHIFFSLFKGRYSRKGIQENMTFSINIPSEEMIEEINICGSKSGRDVDKSKLFDTFYGELENAPMIEQCPLNMECAVTDILDYEQNEGIIGEVIKSYVSEEFLDDKVINLKKAKLLIWTTGGDFSYYSIGERLES